jgi:molybdate transport system substrate-binding protein
MTWRTLSWVLVALASVGACSEKAGGTELLVAAAADLRPAFEEVGTLFTAETGTGVVFDFGSSGQLAQRIIEGAPVDVFASASAGFIDEVLVSGRGDSATRQTYGFGRITIWSRSDGWREWTDLAGVVADPEVRFVAIANPEHAPYGMAARQALESAALWDAVEPRLVLGENVSDTQRLADTGDADVAVVALSLAIAAGERGRWILIDESLHAPLEQVLVVTSDDPEQAEVARGFADFVGSPAGREIMARYGFAPPEVAG